MVLDNQCGAVNDTFNAFDNDPNTLDGGATVNSENAFALFERMTAGGPIVEKPVVALMRAVASGDDFITSSYRVIKRISTDGIDVSRWGSNGVGLANGYIILTHGGDDTVFGSAYGDSLFAGDGDDIVNGGAGHDRIYGGRGADIIFGGDGNDDLYGNSGDDRLNDGAGTNRIDGGTGRDVVEITGASANFNWSGDGRSILITGAMQSTRAINVEKIYFTVDQVMVTLTDADVSIGNGGVAETSVPPTYPDVTVLGTSGADTLVGTWENDVFQGGLGDDTLLGDVGRDIYIYTSGDGNDYIDDEAGFTDNTDVLLLTFNGGVKTGHGAA